MNESLQQLETKVENQGATPQGKVSAAEWNVLVAAVKQLDSSGINDESLKKYLQQYQYITRPELSGILEGAVPDLSGVVNTSGEQDVVGIKNFVNGLKLSNKLIRYDADKNVFIFPGNILAEGGVAWNTKLEGFEEQTITAAVQVDWKTIGKNENGELCVIGGTGDSPGSGGVVGGVTIDEVKNYLTNEGYATQVWVNEQGFLKSITSSMVTSALSYTPFNAANFTKNNIKNTLGISDWALASAKPSYAWTEITSRPTKVSAFTNDSGFITSASLPTKLSQLTDDVVSGNYLLINGTAVNSSKLSGVGLANGSGRNGIPTLSETGYMEVGIAMDFHRYDDGIDFSTRLRVANGNFGNIVWLPTSDGTIALTSDITSALASYVTIGTAQNIAGIKDFINGVKVGGALVTYNAEKNAFVLPANLLVEGGVAWNSSLDGFEPQTVTDAVNVDGVTIGRTTSGALTVLAGAGGGINEAQLADYLTNNNYAKKSDIPSLSGYATEAFVTSRGYITSAAIPTKVSAFDNDSGYITGITSSMVTSALGYTPYNAANFTKANIKSTLGISDWALVSIKPTYTASEVGALGVNDTAQAAKRIVPDNSSINATTWNGVAGLSVGGWNSNGAGFSNTYGTTINFQGISTWYHRLAFATDGVIEHWMGINTTTMSKVGRIAYMSSIPTKVSAFDNDRGYITSSLTGDFTTTGYIRTSKYIETGYLHLTSGIDDSFRTSVFGDEAGWGRMKVLRTGGYATGNYGSLPGTYTTAMAFAMGDTHAFIAIPSVASKAGEVVVGGGNADKLNWSATLLHSSNYSGYAVTLDSTAQDIQGVKNFVNGLTATSVICATGKLRVNASDSVNNFGYIKAITYSSNRGLVHIGSNYGGRSDITNDGADVDAIGIYRGCVGIGRTFTGDELYANQSSGIALQVAGHLKVDGANLSLGGKTITYDSAKNAFVLSANLLVEGGVAWNSPMDGTSAYASELERRIEALQTEVDTLKQTVQTLTA